MAEFSAAAELDVSVPDGQLRDARRQIESELGGVSVDVNSRTLAPDGGTVTGGGAASPAPTGQPRDPSTGQFASPLGNEEFERTSMDQQDELIDLAEERNELLDDLEGVAGGGGGAGGIAATAARSGAAGAGAGAGLGLGTGAGALGGGISAGALLTAAGVAGVVGAGVAGVGAAFQRSGEMEDSPFFNTDTGEMDENPLLPELDPSMMNEENRQLFEELQQQDGGGGLFDFPDLSVEDIIGDALEFGIEDILGSPLQIDGRAVIDHLFGTGGAGGGVPAGANMAGDIHGTGRPGDIQTRPRTGTRRSEARIRENERRATTDTEQFDDVGSRVEVTNDVTINAEQRRAEEIDRQIQRRLEEFERDLERDLDPSRGPLPPGR